MYLKKLEDRKAAKVIEESEPIAVGSDAPFIYQIVKGEGNGNSVLTPCEQEIFSQVAESLGNMAFNLDRNHMKSMINVYLINCGLIDDDFTGISESTLSRIMEKYNLTTTAKTNTIDVARAVQHSTVVLEAYFKMFDNIVHRMHKIDKDKTPWTKWRHVPPEYIYNYDEMGPNANEHQPPAIVSIATLLQKQIVWQNLGTGDSKMLFHFTMGITTQCAGNYHCPKTQQEGAAASFLVSQSGIDELEGKS